MPHINSRYWHSFRAINPLSPHDASKHHFTSLKAHLFFLQLRGFRREISVKLFHQHMVKLTISYNFPPTSSHLHTLQVENCDSNSRLVVVKMTMVDSGLKGLSMQYGTYTGIVTYFIGGRLTVSSRSFVTNPTLFSNSTTICALVQIQTTLVRSCFFQLKHVIFLIRTI